MPLRPTIFLWRRNTSILTSWFAQLFHHQRWACKWRAFIYRALLALPRLGTMVWKACKKHLQLAKWVLFFAQNGYRDRDGGRLPCANGLRICRNEIVPLTKWHLQTPKRDCPLRKLSSHLPKWNCPSDIGTSAIAIGLCTPWRPLHLICDGSIAGKTKGRKQMRRLSMRPVYDSISCPIHPQTGLQRQLRMWQHTNNESTNSISWKR